MLGLQSLTNKFHFQNLYIFSYLKEEISIFVNMQNKKTGNESHLLNQLNDAQREAVLFCDGPSLVIAGAGSGKTRVLTYKIAYLIEQGFPAHNILALTFTNRAAREMRSRIVELISEERTSGLWMGTFHSVFSRILRFEAEAIGFNSNYTILDKSDSRNLIKQIIKEMSLDDKQYRPGSVQENISRAKNSLITPSAYANNSEILKHDHQSRRPMLLEIYQKYQNRLRSANCMDFDDLLMYPSILFRDNKELLDKYRNRFQYILIDEYQDTNFAQHYIVRELAKSHNQICAVGDDAQSIYSFRGANIDNILQYKTNFPNTKIFKLEQNYRSTQNIVNAANSLIKINTKQISKDIYSKNDEGEKIELLSGYSDLEEGTIVANKIMRTRIEDHSHYSDFAILYRTNAQSRIFEESLRKKNIPYRIWGGKSFYQRKEIKDLLAYFRLIVNPDDEDAFRRIINYPARGIGNVTIAKLSSIAEEHQISLWNVISSLEDFNPDIGRGIQKRIGEFHSLIYGFIEQNKRYNAFELAQEVVIKTNFRFDEEGSPDLINVGRMENINELLNAINQFIVTQQEEGDENIKLIDFLSEISLITDQDSNNDEAEQVTLMTVHSAKGLEFNHIFIVGMEEELFPSAMSNRGKEGLEEERRLFYVAITRAKKRCTITYAGSRFKNGQIYKTKKSRFLKEIDPAYLSMERGRGSSVRRLKGSDDSEDFFSYSSAKDKSYSRRRVERSTKPVSPTFRENSIDSKATERLVPIKRAGSNISLSKEAEELEVGDKISHERFGIGLVLSIEMSGHDRRATVEFESNGKKQLLLKFAKFKIIEKGVVR